MGSMTPMTPAVMDDDEVLRFTQQTRKGLVDALTNEGKAIPADNKDRMILLETLKHMDQQSLTKKRLVGDAKNAESDRAAALIALRLFQQIGTKNPFEKRDAEPGRVIDMPDTLLENVEPVPGEMEIGLSSETYDTFTASRGE